VVVERMGAGTPPWRYAGEAVTAEASYPLGAVVDGRGGVAVELPPGAPEGLAAKVRLILRAALKHVDDDDGAPPRRIARWRAEL
jgi:hypothetical protein